MQNHNGLSIIQQYPSRFDQRTGKLLSGNAGSFVLERLFPYSRKEIYIASLIDEDTFMPDTTKVILLLGSKTRSVLDTQESLDDIRGYAYNREGITYIHSYFPQDTHDIIDFEGKHNPLAKAEVLRKASSNELLDAKSHGKTARKNWRFWLSQDLLKVKRIMREGVHRNKCNYYISPPLNTVLRALREYRQRDFFFDIETNPITQQMTCFSFGDEITSYAIPLIDEAQSLYYGTTGTAQILRELAMCYKYNRVVIHNANFDLFITLDKYRIPLPPTENIACTMNMHHRLYPDVEVSLGHCVSIYTDQPFHKGDAEFFYETKEQFAKLLLYNARDVETLALVYKELLKRGEKMKALGSFEQANRSIRTYLTMTYRGIKLDTARLCTLIDTNNKHALALQSKVLFKLVGYPLNPNSPQQVADYMYNKLHLKKASKNLTDTTAIYNILTKKFIPALKVIIKIRQLRKEASDLKFKMWKGDRLTCSYKVHGTASFRLGSAALFGTNRTAYKANEYGRNAQNWSKRVRVLCIPEDSSHEFTQIDQKGAEARIVAYIAKPGKLRQLFEHNIKSHSYVAMHLFKAVWAAEMGIGMKEMIDICDLSIPDLSKLKILPELQRCIQASDNNTPNKRFYYFGKQTCHSANYGIGAYAFIMNILDRSGGEVVLDMRQGTQFLHVYHTLFPEIKDWNGQVLDYARRHKVLYNLFGHPIKITRHIDPTTYKDLYALIPQSTVGVLTHIAADEIQTRLDSGEYKDFCLMQNNHDSLLTQHLVDEGLRVGKLAMTHFNQRLTTPDGTVFYMESEVSTGKNWKEMEELNI